MLIRVISRYEDCAVRQIRRVQNAAAEHKAALETVRSVMPSAWFRL